jgi:hypothetical protein
MTPKVMLVGLGNLGSVLLELLARDSLHLALVVGSRNADRAAARCNLARLGAAAQGRHPDIRFVPLDLDNVERTVATLAAERPAIVIGTASMQTWWLPDLLPPRAAEAVGRAGFGAWLPVHLAPMLKLMQAVQAAGVPGVWLTAPFPDVVNVVLGRAGLAPTCGIGNLGEIVPKVRLLAAGHLGCPPEAVRVVLVAHHALEPLVYEDANRDVPPHFLRVYHGSLDVTREVEAERLLLSPWRLPPGPAIHFLTAATTVRLVRALCSQEDHHLHVPAPCGLPGGYPVVVGAGRVEVEPIDGLSLHDAIALNEQSHRFDGIERIERDGTVVFCEASAAAMREALGYNCGRLDPGEARPRAEELIRRFREFARRHGVDLERLPLP